MWTLTIEDEDGNTTHVTLQKEVYILGRASPCDVVLDARNVSRRHARLACASHDRWVIEDLGSAYGIFVNGQRLERAAPLMPHDAWQLGDFRLSLQHTTPGAALTRPLPLVAPAESIENGVVATDRPQLPDRLRFLGGPPHGHELRLDRGPLLFGDDPDCLVRFRVPSDNSGQRRLLVRPLTHGHYEVVDQSTPPQLTVNGQSLARKILDERDLIELGSLLRLRFLPQQRLYNHEIVTPVPLRPLPDEPDLTGAVHQGRVLGLGARPGLAAEHAPRHDTPRGPTLKGLQAPGEADTDTHDTLEILSPELPIRHGADAAEVPDSEGYDTEPTAAGCYVRDPPEPPSPEPPSREVPGEPRRGQLVGLRSLGTGGAEMPLPVSLYRKRRSSWGQRVLLPGGVLVGITVGAWFLAGRRNSSPDDTARPEPILSTLSTSAAKAPAAPSMSTGSVLGAAASGVPPRVPSSAVAVAVATGAASTGSTNGERPGKPTPKVLSSRPPRDLDAFPHETPRAPDPDELRRQREFECKKSGKETCH